jgi:ribose 5-phosphate isomerase A
MVIGLGTGSTARHVLDVLGEQLIAHTLRDLAGVATSATTAAHARTVGIPLIDLDDVREVDVAIDGADEVDPRLDLIKGLGGALLWEKIVASAAARFIVVVDETKLVQRLGERAAVPVEVVPFGWRTLFERAGAQPNLRLCPDGSPFRTDGGHLIIDCTFPQGIADARATEYALRSQAGVVETGLFLGMAHAIIVGGREISVLQPPGA